MSAAGILHANSDLLDKHHRTWLLSPTALYRLDTLDSSFVQVGPGMILPGIANIVYRPPQRMILRDRSHTC
jgi:hypothetical protein